MKIRLKWNSLLRPAPLEPGDRRLWVGGFLAVKRRKGSDTTWWFEFYWKRALIVGSILGSVAYLAAATALWVWFDRSPQNKVKWSSIALAPVQREHFRQLRGETAIATALEKLRLRDYVEGFHGLRAGLARAPGHVEGRITLARLFAFNDPARALGTLEAGLAHSAEDVTFLRTLFSFYQQQQAYDRALVKARELVARQPALPAPALQLLGTVQAAIFLERGEAAAAEQMLAGLPAAGDDADSTRRALLHITALIRLGRHEEARAEIERVARGGDTLELQRLRAELAIAMDDATALEGALRRMRASAPEGTQVYLYGFQAWQRMKRITLRDRAEQEFYQLFGAQDHALQLFAAAAANQGLAEVVQRTMQVAQRSRLSTFAFRVHLTELALRRGDFDAAFRQLPDWEKQVETLNVQQRVYPRLVSLLARAAIGGAAESTVPVLTHLAEMRGRATPSVVRLVASVLELSGNPEGAREAVAVGLRFFPYNDGLQADEPRLALVIQKRSEIAAGARAEARDGSGAGAIPATAKAALGQLDQAIQAGSLVAARDQLRAIRSARPDWLAGVESEVAAREVHLAVLLQEPASARTLLRGFLSQHHREVDALLLVGVAEQLAAAGRGHEARLVHDEVLAARGSILPVAQRLKALGLVAGGEQALASAELALRGVDDALARNDAEAALRLIEQVRQAAPRWLAAAQPEITVREVRVRLALGQQPTALFVFKDFVLKSTEARMAAFRMVRELAANGEEKAALLLARELVKLMPGQPAAANLLKEIEAPQPVPES